MSNDQNTKIKGKNSYSKHTNDISTKYVQLKPAIKFYKMRLYRALTVTPCDVWEYALADLFKHIVKGL